MLIKLYIHPNKLEALQNKEPIIAKTMTTSQYDIEIFVNTKKVKIIPQGDGVLLTRYKFIERLKGLGIKW